MYYWDGDGFSSKPRKAEGGIKARSEDGEFGRNWWAKKWLQAMERLTFAARLQRGQHYARQGQVVAMEENNGTITAKVQGSRSAPYKVTIKVVALKNDQWEKVLDVLASQAIFAAQLLAGEMPGNIEDAFRMAGVSLFPMNNGDLYTHCTCPDWANPCKHIAATHYILGDRFDEDPFLLLRMRGRTQEQIMEGLRKRRGSTPLEEEAPSEPLEETERIPRLDDAMENYWELKESLDSFSVNIQQPNITFPILKRLGEPDFATRLPMQDLLSDVYLAFSQAALAMAYHGGEIPLPEEENDND